MPLDPEALRELLARRDGAAIAADTRPLLPGEAPLPPSVRADSAEARRFILRSAGHALDAVGDPACAYPEEAVAGNIEGYVGVARIPVGVIGPLRVRGTAAGGDFYVPMATTEGALVA